MGEQLCGLGWGRMQVRLMWIEGVIFNNFFRHPEGGYVQNWEMGGGRRPMKGEGRVANSERARVLAPQEVLV